MVTIVPYHKMNEVKGWRIFQDFLYNNLGEIIEYFYSIFSEKNFFQYFNIF